jgi:hypothetical protein
MESAQRSLLSSFPWEVGKKQTDITSTLSYLSSTHVPFAYWYLPVPYPFLGGALARTRMYTFMIIGGDLAKLAVHSYYLDLKLHGFSVSFRVSEDELFHGWNTDEAALLHIEPPLLHGDPSWLEGEAPGISWVFMAPKVSSSGSERALTAERWALRARGSAFMAHGWASTAPGWDCCPSVIQPKKNNEAVLGQNCYVWYIVNISAIIPKML